MIEDEEIILNREKIQNIFKEWQKRYLLDILDYDTGLINKEEYSERAMNYFIRLFYELNPGV